MTDDINHTPSPEFRESLERDILGELRRERMFGPAEDKRRVRMASIIGIAAGAVMTLTIGLMLGASTGFASAGELVRERGDTPLPPARGLAVLKNISPLMRSCAELPSPTVATLPAKQGVPVIDLPNPSARTSITLGSVLGLRELPNGNLLVNDGGRRQVRLMDSTLNTRSIVRDSIPGTSTSYGSRPIPLMRYLGDSSLLVDRQAGTMLVMGPSGQVSRVMAGKDDDMLLGLVLDYGAVDTQGRVVYSASIRNQMERGVPGGIQNFYSTPDSNGIFRVDLDSRRVDTLATYKRGALGSMMIKNGPGPTKFTSDPAPLLDAWATTIDGAIGIVRGHDYHVDWIMPDGSTKSAPKMPFDWKRLSDEEKQRLIDSTRDAESPRMALNLGRRRATPADAPADGRTGRGSVPPGEIIQGPAVPVEYVPPRLSDMFDFYPPIRQHAVTSDLDGNIWILPSTSAQSKNGELVYDVTNSKGEFWRVRFPAGRSLAGFGKGGVIYLLAGDKVNGFYLEKTRIPRK
jgi:hypothetical protein